LDDAQLMQEQMNVGAGGMGGPDINKIYQAEKDNLELVKHEWELESVEERLMGKFIAKEKSKKSENDIRIKTRNEKKKK
jgi:hypothetical protein